MPKWPRSGRGCVDDERQTTEIQSEAPAPTPVDHPPSDVGLTARAEHTLAGDIRQYAADLELRYLTARNAWSLAMRIANSGRSKDLASTRDCSAGLRGNCRRARGLAGEWEGCDPAGAPPGAPRHRGRGRPGARVAQGSSSAEGTGLVRSHSRIASAAAEAHPPPPAAASSARGAARRCLATMSRTTEPLAPMARGSQLALIY